MTDSRTARFGAEAAAAEPPALAAREAFGLAHIGAVTDPDAGTLELVAL